MPNPTETAMLRVMLVEDSALLRGMLEEMIEEIDGVEVAGDADGESLAIEQLRCQPVDLAIVDLELNEGSGFGVLEHLMRSPEPSGRPRAVVFSTYANRAVRQRCKALGADAFFDKSDGLDDLLDYIETAARGQSAG
ncbi:MAG: response regulator transcription factor [Rhodocyclaceae bacterium]|nr:response regulator transcription factor [Rhodocyclaceae bacterium]